MTIHLITEPLRVEVCPRCDATILRGHTGGLNTRVDPQPLDPQTELAALLAGKHTFDMYLESWPVRMYLEWRDAVRIDNGYKHLVVAQHKCERRQGPSRPRPARGGDLFDEWRPTDNTDDIPPF